ncbi:MAG: cell well associated RhsD protein [Mucilaginibacter sp.]|nr:cell well associated RhsD protein [Mucilaginibacter sp.]
MYLYGYDQLDRLTKQTAFSGLNPTTNVWTPVSLNDYKENVSYDGNGNIKTYVRNGNYLATNTTAVMDNLTYNYSKDINGVLENNRLTYPSELSKNGNSEIIIQKKNCLDALSKFADTLKVYKEGLLNDTNKEKNNVIKNCHLKDYRHEIKMQSAIVLIMLKFYNYDLKQGWAHERGAVLADMSNLTNQIIFEYAYLYYGKERYYTEDLYVEDVISFIKKNPVFLKNSQNKKQYDDSFKFNRKR